MALGPGKYDKQCVAAREACKAEGAILMVFNGEFGHGFSAVLPFEVLSNVPSVLRQVADDIERSLPMA